jgi:hypothetical protein
MSPNDKFSESVTRAFVNQTALLLAGLIIISFSRDYPSRVLRTICKFPTLLLLFKILLYIVQSSARSLIFDTLYSKYHLLEK